MTSTRQAGLLRQLLLQSLFLFFLPCASAYAYEISGKVTDRKTGEELAGVSVVLNGPDIKTTVTDAEGVFSIESDYGTSDLVLSLLGYVTLRVEAGPDTGFMSLEMEIDNFRLDEIVVTGQAAEIQKKRLSSNISSVTEDEMKKMPEGRIDRMLQNALPNMQITLSNGQPGTTSQMKSRGLSSAYTNSTPVIYVDGVRVDNLNTAPALNNILSGNTAASGSIGDIPMENIERIEYVTGGAATTLYGSDAANGVIQIFTKKGGDGRFNASFRTEMGAAIASSQFYHFRRTKELLHRPGFYQKYSISMDGGKGDLGYSLGASMSGDTGTLIQDGNKDRKYDIRFGLRAGIGDKLEYSNSFGFVAQEYKRTRNGNQGYYTGLWFTEGAAASNFTYKDAEGNTLNYLPDIDANDDYAYSQMKSFVDKAESLQNNTENIRRFQTSHSLSYSPISTLTLKATLGLDFRNNTNKDIVTNEYLIHTQVKPAGTSDAGSINNFMRNYLSLTGELNAQHRYMYKDVLSMITTAGFQFFSTYDHQAVFNGTNVRDGALVITGAGTVTADEWLSYLYNYGAYIQENIGLSGKYYLDLGLRTDYNTAFGDNVGWQFYPKVGLSYQMSDERFMAGAVRSGIINSLRFFANYGIAGSYPPAFEYQKTIDVGSFQGSQAATFGKYGNPDLGPEKKHSYEAGFNSVLFHRVLNLGFTYYYALTRDAIFSVPSLPSSGQASNYLANVGVIENKGIELFAGVQILDTRDWNIRFNASFNTNSNTVLSTGGTVPFAVGGFSSRTVQTVVQEGKPVGFIRGSKAVLNEDGSLKEVLELQDLGNTLPKIYGNLSLNISYRNFSFYLSGDYQAGSYVHSFDRQFRFAKGLKDPAIPDRALEGTTQAKEWLNFTNFFVEKADFLKIRNIGVDYTINLKKGLKGIEVGFNVFNPFSFTASSVDPEAVLSGGLHQGGITVGGLNYSTYSVPRQYIASVKLLF